MALVCSTKNRELVHRLLETKQSKYTLLRNGDYLLLPSLKFGFTDRDIPFGESEATLWTTTSGDAKKGKRTRRKVLKFDQI